MVTLKLHAEDSGTYVVHGDFTDEDGVATIPDTLTWTLTNADGDVVNSRSAVVVAAPAASVDVVLSGDDLDRSKGSSRVFRFSGTYTSTLGSGLLLKGGCMFKIDDPNADYG